MGPRIEAIMQSQVDTIVELRQALTDARNMAEKYREMADRARDLASKAVVRADKAVADSTRLRKALQEYGKHHETCAITWSTSLECSCGFATTQGETKT